PAGQQIKVDGRLISSTLAPDGRTAAALTWQNFTGYVSVIDVANGSVLQQVHLETQHLGDGTVSFDGAMYSRGGTTLRGPEGTDIGRFAGAADGELSSPMVIRLTSSHGAAIPSGMALSNDGKRLYAALNGDNSLAVINTKTNAVISRIPVGNAPRQVVVTGN